MGNNKRELEVSKIEYIDEKNQRFISLLTNSQLSTKISTQ